MLKILLAFGLQNLRKITTQTISKLKFFLFNHVMNLSCLIQSCSQEKIIEDYKKKTKQNLKKK